MKPGAQPHQEERLEKPKGELLNKVSYYAHSGTSAYSGARRTVTSGGLRLPDFIGVGPPRTATTWLHQALKGHVGLPENIKETNFFYLDYYRGFEWYTSLFRNCPVSVPIGEFSPNYFAYPEVRERIAALVPNCKIIITLRDPVERLYSQYRKGYEQAYFVGSFEETLKSRPDLLDWSCYAGHVRDWYNLFGRENVLVLIHDALKSNPQEFLNCVTQFIGVEPISIEAVPSASEQVNAVSEMPRSQYLALLARTVRDWLYCKGGTKIVRMLGCAGLRSIFFGGGQPFAPLRAETEARLRRQFEPEIRQLEQLLGYSLPQWREQCLMAVRVS